MSAFVMGSCETLNPRGFKFVLEIGAPLTDEKGNRIAPLALVLETYTRNPTGKHAILELLAQHGYELPDTPMIAFHRVSILRFDLSFSGSPRDFTGIRD